MKVEGHPFLFCFILMAIKIYGLNIYVVNPLIFIMT